MPQADFSKGFDSFAPLGPALVSTRLVRDPSAGLEPLTLKTTVDGELRQEASVADLAFPVQRLIAFLSSGTTLQKGSVIMTGTPAGKTDYPVPHMHTRGFVIALDMTLTLSLTTRYRLEDESAEVAAAGNYSGGTYQ